MKKYLCLFILMYICFNVKGQNKTSYFWGGIQYGMTLNTIYKYTGDFNYFDELNYGKKVTPTFGVFVKRDLFYPVSLEMGFFYHKRGTRYRIFYSSKEKLRFGSYGHILDLHYISVPVIINKMCDRYSQYSSYRFGVEFSNNFFVNIPHVPDASSMLYNKYDYSGLFGFKFKPKHISFFNNKTLVVDFRFSILPIINEELAYMLESSKDFNILPNQRNYSISICLQHDFITR